MIGLTVSCRKVVAANQLHCILPAAFSLIDMGIVGMLFHALFKHESYCCDIKITPTSLIALDHIISGLHVGGPESCPPLELVNTA